MNVLYSFNEGLKSVLYLKSNDFYSEKTSSRTFIIGPFYLLSAAGWLGKSFNLFIIAAAAEADGAYDYKVIFTGFYGLSVCMNA